MITLDYEIDEKSISEAGKLDLRETSGTDLVWDLFQLPVTLIISGVTFLGNTREEILRLARDGLYKVRRLPKQNIETLTFKRGGGLKFELEGPQVLVSSMGMNRSSRADYADLLRTWEDFSQRVRRELTSKFPELNDHPVLGEFFREGFEK